MEEQPKYEYQPPGIATAALEAGSLAQQLNQRPCQDLTADQQIRMKALELGIQWLTQEPPQPSEAAPDINEALFWSCVRDFEDYLKKGRK